MLKEGKLTRLGFLMENLCTAKVIVNTVSSLIRIFCTNARKLTEERKECKRCNGIKIQSNVRKKTLSTEPLWMLKIWRPRFTNGTSRRPYFVVKTILLFTMKA